jgi:hypothetical protein
MAAEHFSGSSQASDGRPRNNGLEKCGRALAQETPRAWPGQAAVAKRGESARSSTRGSRKRMVRR